MTTYIPNDWYYPVFDFIKESMKKAGVEIDDIYFDLRIRCGVYFNGQILDWWLFLPKIGITNEVLLNFAESNWIFKFKYYERRDMEYDVEILCPDHYEDEDRFIYHYSPYPEEDFRSAAWLAVLKQYDYDSIVEDIKNKIDDYRREAYKLLIEEYESYEETEEEE